MTQKPAYTDEDVIEAGMGMRAKGKEPDKASLWTELGRRGVPDTAWRKWQKHRENQPTATVLAWGREEDRSPEMDSAMNAHQQSMAALLACARSEAEAPLRRRIQALEEALNREMAKAEGTEQLVEALQEELASRDAQIAELRHAGDRPSLILP